jgi:ubiquinone/menaquinone biosynthesis C-methylase UbiE
MTTPWIPLLTLTLSFLAFSQAGGTLPGWQQAEYERERDAYERRRDTETQIGRALDIAGVKPGMTVGEVGAGNGYFTLKLARRVGQSGRVYANDIIENYGLGELRDRAKQQGLSNIETILGTETDPRLPSGRLDMVFLVAVLHDLTRPVEILEKVAVSLKPGAKVVIVENENVENDGMNPGPQTRREFLDIFARTRFVVERIDKSLPHPRSVVFILALR